MDEKLCNSVGTSPRGSVKCQKPHNHIGAHEGKYTNFSGIEITRVWGRESE